MTKLERSIIAAWGLFGLIAVIGIFARRAVLLEWLPAIAMAIFVLMGAWIVRELFGSKPKSGGATKGSQSNVHQSGDRDTQ